MPRLNLSYRAWRVHWKSLGANHKTGLMSFHLAERMRSGMAAYFPGYPAEIRMDPHAARAIERTRAATVAALGSIMESSSLLT